MRRFTLRDLFWLTLVVGLGVGWWMRDAQLLAVSQRRKATIQALQEFCSRTGWSVTINQETGEVLKVESRRDRSGEWPAVPR
jgi:hypothetical protein